MRFLIATRDMRKRYKMKLCQSVQARKARPRAGCEEASKKSGMNLPAVTDSMNVKREAGHSLPLS